jgi:ribonucleoside-triphosphate reductase (thioredoxin)
MSLIDKVKLSEEFLAQYRNKQPKWGFGGLGYIVYLRTYARKKPDGTLERWDETVQRITEGNFKIEAKRLEEIGKLTEDRVKLLISEMERFYHLVFNLVMSPPGRGLWMSGTEYAERVGDAENNCWGVSMRPQPYGNSKIKPHDGDIEKPRVSFAPVFTFDQAMKGGGVGVNVQRKYVNQIPQVNNTLDLDFIVDYYHGDFDELDELGVYRYDDFYGNEWAPVFKVPDSREGWAQALQRVIDAHYEGITELVIDVSDIRPRGAEIKGFGGVASGPAPLVEMLTKVNEILNRRVNDYVTPTEWGDIIQLIGTCVVAGNVRRTALILIGDQNDKEFVESKNYSLPQNVEASQWRWASNNSVDIGINTDREILRNLAVNIYYNGEPGYVNVELSRNFGRIIDGFQKDIDGEVEVFNPCGNGDFASR